MMLASTTSLTRRRFLLQRRQLSAVVSREVTVRNCRFHVEHRHPDAPHQILCLPGSLGTAKTDFSEQLRSGIGEEFGLVAIDPRGLGESNTTTDGKKFARDYPADFYVQDAQDGADIMRELGYDEYSVMGWSDGANAAMHLAANREVKDAVKKLVVFGGNSYVTEEDIEAYEAVRDVSKSWSERMRNDKSAAHGGLETLQILNDRYTDAMREILYDHDGDVCLAELHNITCPTLILHGALDVICHDYHAQYIAKHITNSQLKVLPQGKHNLHMKYADKFREIVGDFLTDRPLESNCEEDDEPDIDHIAYGFMGSKALFAALRVGIFDAIDSMDGLATFDDIESACDDISGERLKTLLSACVALKLIRRRIDENGTNLFDLPKASSQQLVQTSRHYWGDYLTMQVDGQFYNRLEDIDNTIKYGTEASHGYESWFDSDPVAAKNYTRAQHNGSLATAYALHKRLPELATEFPSMRMLDVGGGSGAFSIVTSRVIQDATAVVLDLPNVIETTKSIISEEEESVRRRVSTLALSATDPGSWENVVEEESFDVVLLSYVSGSIPSEALAGLYSNAFRALKPGGKAVIHDFFINNDGRGPPNAALWALAHVSVNPDGMGLIPKRIINILSEQGFIAPRVHELIPGMTKVIVAKKKRK